MTSSRATVLGTENTMAIDRRQKNDRELPPFVRSTVHAGEHRAQRILDPFDRQQPTLFHASHILDRSVAGTEDLGRAVRNGTILRLQTASEQRVERPIVFERASPLLARSSPGGYFRTNVSRKSRGRSRREGTGRRDSLTARTARHNPTNPP